MKVKYKSIVFIAEIYNPNEYTNHLQFGRFDYLYDKVGLYDTLRNVITDVRPSSDITGIWQGLGDLQPRMLNFLENHDEQRIASDFFAGDPFKAIPALIVSATINTNPFLVYCGQELGERGMDKEGFSGLDGRTTIFDYWSVDSIRNWYNDGKFGLAGLTDQQKNLRKVYTKILSICNSEEAISEGKFYDLMYANYENPNLDPTKIYAYLRGTKKELLLVLVNFSSESASVTLNMPKDALVFFNADGKQFKYVKDLISAKKEILKPGLTNEFETKLLAKSGKILKFYTE